MKVVGYTAYPWEHALTLLRLVQPIERAGISFIKGNDYERIFLDEIPDADLVVIQRDFPRWKDSYQRVVTQARAHGKPVIHENDDLLLELPDNHPDRHNHYYSQAAFPILQAIIEADAVTATTPLLCDYLKAFNSNIWLLPNYLDDRGWDLGRPIRMSEQDPVIIGYMGSTTHLHDLETITPALGSLLEHYGDRIQLKFWGCEPPASLLSRSEVEWIPMQIPNYSEFARFFSRQECDIFIAPLADNPFNRCKSSIKFLEYSALGVPGVYSCIPPYQDIIKPGENGFLARDIEEWLQALTTLIEAPSLRWRIGEEARQTVTEDWLLTANANRWKETFTRILENTSHKTVENAEPIQSVLRIASVVQEWQETLENQIVNQAAVIQALTGQVEESTARAANLERQLEDISRSPTGRMVLFIWRIRLWLFPHNSRRERIFEKLTSPLKKS